ncbi:MAG: zinc ribbon domain-containing protein [Gammaproteobacteria bacterium]|jgi:putative FmdB family regulatory protein|nr:zinc ribbon domain-containing protein [Gammaproteobacteria bacterium]
MPIYEYRCRACGHEMEKLRKLSDPPLVDCPECGEPALDKLISAAGFRLKGGGWYETDFKKDNKRNLAGEGKSEKKSDGGGSSKADSKPSSASDKKASDTSSTSSGQAA